MKTRNTSLFVRASISFPPEIYQNLQNLAKQKKVSLAWVVRDAAERYVSAEADSGEPRKRPNAANATKSTRTKRQAL
jgi:metal-responsive CopG/Arc/MetJ family transcriptional regulator